MPRTIVVLVAGACLTMAVTGLVMLWHWRALAARGVDLDARIQACHFESVGRRTWRGPTSGYHSCTYSYRPAGADGPVHEGYFQSSRSWSPGEGVAIRYLPDRPEVSATSENLEHPSFLPGALIVLGLGGLAFFIRGWRKSSVG